jgi:hypothetical protein
LNVFDYIKTVQGQKATKEPDTVSEPAGIDDSSHTDSDAGASNVESDREDEDELSEAGGIARHRGTTCAVIWY